MTLHLTMPYEVSKKWNMVEVVEHTEIALDSLAKVALDEIPLGLDNEQIIELFFELKSDAFPFWQGRNTPIYSDCDGLTVELFCDLYYHLYPLLYRLLHQPTNCYGHINVRLQAPDVALIHAY